MQNLPNRDRLRASSCVSLPNSCRVYKSIYTTSRTVLPLNYPPTFLSSIMYLLYVSFFLLLPSLVSSQALPDLPVFPSPSPPPSPSPLPSELLALISSPPSRPTAVPARPTSTPSENQPSQLPQPSPSTLPNGVPVPSNIPLPNPSISPTPNFINDDGECERDMSRPRPKLGKSQRRYAIAVLASAAAVGVASLLYSAVHSWTVDNDVYVRPFLCVVAARVLIFGAVRASAALVGSITKASPNDSALDASGAFLTWASAIFTRLYNEGFIFTAAVLDLINKDGACVSHLQEYFKDTRVTTSDAPDIPAVKTSVGQAYDNGIGLQEKQNVSTWRAFVTSRWEKKLFLLAIALYVAQETTVLIVNVLTLVGSFAETEPSLVFFSADEEDGQCPLNGSDIRAISATVILQGLYAITYQPSLAPLLSIGWYHNEKWKFSSGGLRALSWIVLLIWPVTLLVLPLLQGALEKLFVAGDLSLFYLVFIGPPRYTSPGFIITATYTCTAALVGAILIYRIFQYNKNDVHAKDAVP